MSETADSDGPTRLELLAELVALGDGADDPPTMIEMKVHGAYGEWDYRHEFGNWGEALKAAGYDEEEIGRQSNYIPDVELLFDLRCGAAVLGRSMTANEYRSWGSYTYQTIWRRFGGWDEALEAADLPPSGEPVDLVLADLEAPESRSQRDNPKGSHPEDGDPQP